MALLAGTMESPAKAVRALSFKLACALGHEDYQRFVLLSRSRTGSNLLISLLNAHPGIRAEWEVFARTHGQDPLNILARIYGKQPHYVKARGFKLFYYHPLDQDGDDLWEELGEDRQLRVLHLKRRNILRTLVSRKIAGVQDIWAAGSAVQPRRERPKATRFSVAELEEGFRETRDWEAKGDRTFRNHPLLPVYYEDLVADRQACLGEVLDFLRLPRLPLRSDMRKQNPERLADLIANYAELKAAFAGSEWQRFFDE